MHNTKTVPVTHIEGVASQQDIARILAAQYAHMTEEDARATLSTVNSPVWSNDELMAEFEVSHFNPPYVHVIKKDSGERGTVAFIDKPRLYFAFQAESKDDARTA